MKKSLTIVAILATTLAFGQAQIPNMDFEAVFTATGTNPSGIPIQYDSLNGGWTSGNPVKRYIAIDDATHEYQFMMDTNYTWDTFSQTAIVMRSFMIGPVLATGNVGTGAFVFNSTNPFKSARFGVPFTDRPISLIGYYQYKSVAGDTCRIEIMLTKWDATTSSRDTVGRGVLFDNNTFNSFKQFSIPINYNSTDTPDTLTIYCLSSAYGLPAADTIAPRGKAGSTLIIDDFKLIYNTNGIEEHGNKSKAKIFASNGIINVNFDEKPSKAKVQIVDLSGKTIFTSTLTKKNNAITIENKGILIVNVVSEKGSKKQKILLQ